MEFTFDGHNQKQRSTQQTDYKPAHPVPLILHSPLSAWAGDFNSHAFGCCLRCKDSNACSRHTQWLFISLWVTSQRICPCFIHTMLIVTLDVSAGPGTSAYTSCVSWQYWSYLSNRDAGRPKSSRTAHRRTAYRTTRQTTIAQTTTATRKTKPHEARNGDAAAENTWDELETTESWSVAGPFTWRRTKYRTLWKILTDRKTRVQRSVKTSSSKDDSNHTSNTEYETWM